ncbi:phosphate ABC transporter ATP-binding protein [Chamaesiphon sp. VAR_48_metabat_135_sub]|uniref:phosphate ABC transporter ATP-binding protein n=1 Tax=Chamaesiphon sp. VAR_48_metabat_135_sub TaxID=2964699 RepID=UPI00286B2C86|nr:phosphate ABC transporter ATP-binding protein [Chamaesiphon sp. VAR_48_metabat_135_sub]
MVNYPEDSAVLERNGQVSVDSLNFYYSGNIHALKNVSMPIYDRKTIAVLGAPGAGRTTLLRCFNRMHDLVPGNRYEGAIWLQDGSNLIGSQVDPIAVRMRIGMVFDRPNPLPKSIYENVTYGLKLRGEKDRNYLNDRVEQALKDADLWDEVKDRLNSRAAKLSLGQQQQLCIARALATSPEIILIDEPTSILSQIETSRIEESIYKLKGQITILISTHSMQQASRLSDYTAFIEQGQLIEFDRTAKMFAAPTQQQTKDFVSGLFR